MPAGSNPSNPPAPPATPPAAPPTGGGGPRTPPAAVMAPSAPGTMPLGMAVTADGSTGVVTARQAGGLIDLRMQVSPKVAPLVLVLQNMAKAINVAFQTNFGENHLETVYQAAIAKKNEVQIVHREYFGYGMTWFSTFGMLLKSMQLTLKGPDPASPEGMKLIQERGPRTISGLLNLMGRKMDIVPEYEDKVPYYVEQMLDRLEASGIIVGWNREEWTITTTRVGLNIRIRPVLEEEG